MSDYRTDLNQKLEAARNRVRQGREFKALKASAPSLFEVIDGEITLAVNKLTADKAVSYDEYLDLHGQITGIMRIRNLISSKEVEAEVAAQEVEGIKDTLKQFEDDQKQQ